MGGKRITGRKRHLLVDTLGNVLLVLVTPADVPDRDAAYDVLQAGRAVLPTLRHVWADAAYAGDLEEWAQEELGCTIAIVRTPPDQHTFVVQSWRWIVERTLAWLGRNRRFSRDVEHDEVTTETLMYLTSSHLLLKRLRPVLNC
jgi:putative transposase